MHLVFAVSSVLFAFLQIAECEQCVVGVVSVIQQ